MFEVKGNYGTAKVFSQIRDEKAVEQIQVLMDQPFVESSRVRIMPDYHWGAGCTIGFTAVLGGYIVPNLVGVDIGCGMYVESLGKQDFDLKSFDRVVHEIPSGFNSWKQPLQYAPFMRELLCFDQIKSSVIDKQVGTLGGGNHFVELDRNEDTGEIFLVIHSGSRNIGKQVADRYQKLAEKTCNADVPKPLKYLKSELAQRYLHDMHLCQKYASLNRQTMGKYINQRFGIGGSTFQTIHNYINQSDNIIRKDAVSAKKGEKLIIPLNMRDGSLVCVGKGNRDWNNSAPHGAGRLYGRKEALRTFNLQVFKATMKDVFSTTVNRDTLDEAPMVYKPMDEIVNAIQDTVTIESHLKPIYNFKAGRE
ncbi:MAG: RtcB family protein [Anaerolineaceae bacterium]|jgi:RNA-splicing ligase RtcB|nr:RtcB family protein [Anaerolineaceae bacterium]